MMPSLNGKMHLFCFYSSPLSAERVCFNEYIAGLLGGKLSYRQAPGGRDEPPPAAAPSDMILLHEGARPWWRRVLGLTQAARLTAQGATSVLVVRQPHWPLERILLIFRAEASDEAAVAWAGELAQAAGAAITVLPILPPIPALYAPSQSGRPNSDELLATAAPPGALLRRLFEQLQRRRIPAVMRLGTGEPVWQMREAMADQKYDLVIIGAEAPDWLHRFLAADLVGPLLRCANCSLLVARGTPRCRAERWPWQPANIVETDIERKHSVPELAGAGNGRRRASY